MNLLQSIILGLVSGFAEFLPVSSQAHQAILIRLFGVGSIGGFERLMIHGAVLAALILSNQAYLRTLHREMRISALPRRRRRRQPDPQSVLTIQHIKSAFFLLVIGFLFYPVTASWQYDLHIVALFLLLNGVILFVPTYFSTGNKDARSVSMLDSVVMGFGAALGVLPGISRMGASMAACSLRGADGKHSLNWAMLLSIPALVFLIGFDVQMIFTQGFGIPSLGYFIQTLLCAGAAFFGAHFAIVFLRFLSAGAGFSGFSFYCWGAALFCFILYLI